MKLALEYWRDGKWYFGRLENIPGVFSQGKSLVELMKNIQDAFCLLSVDNAAEEM